MQLCARDGDTTVLSIYAQKGKNYTCPLCGSTLRLRGGRYTELHFFHINPKSSCKNAIKSAIHLQVQLRLKKIFSDALLEYYFPEITRFADVVIPSKKLIFEVQCSPISLFEVRARQAAYAKTGFQLIWILHEKTFNKRQLSDSELYLRQHPSYFTNITSQGHGYIFDQFELTANVKRFYIGKKCPVDFRQTYYFKENILKDVPQALCTRIRSWPLFFKNDLIYRIWQNPEFSNELKQLEIERAKSWKRQELNRWISRLKARYQLWLHKKLLRYTDSE